MYIDIIVDKQNKQMEDKYYDYSIKNHERAYREIYSLGMENGAEGCAERISLENEAFLIRKEILREWLE